MSLLLDFVYFFGIVPYRKRRQFDNSTPMYFEKQIIPGKGEINRAASKTRHEERERISADLHDEIGSGLTAIRLMSEIARKKLKNNPIPEIQKISSSADDLLNKMHAIIWSMNNGNDTLENLVSYTQTWIVDYFENTDIKCCVWMPPFIPDIEISGDKRRNIFLCVKESLNNIIKHSKATEVTFEFICDNYLSIIISDNGIGIDLSRPRIFGNGLKNIRRRMELVGGRFVIENVGGTRTLLELRIDNS